MARHFFLCLKNKEKTLINHIIEVMTYQFLRRNWSNSFVSPSTSFFLPSVAQKILISQCTFKARTSTKKWRAVSFLPWRCMPLCCVSEEKLTAVIRRTVNRPDPLLTLTLRFGKKASIKTSIWYKNNLRNRGKGQKKDGLSRPNPTQSWKNTFSSEERGAKPGYSTTALTERQQPPLVSTQRSQPKFAFLSLTLTNPNRNNPFSQPKNHYRSFSTGSYSLRAGFGPMAKRSIFSLLGST